MEKIIQSKWFALAIIVAFFAFFGWSVRDNFKSCRPGFVNYKGTCLAGYDP
jgi:hypothetical protein